MNENGIAYIWFKQYQIKMQLVLPPHPITRKYLIDHRHLMLEFHWMIASPWEFRKHLSDVLPCMHPACDLRLSIPWPIAQSYADIKNYLQLFNLQERFLSEGYHHLEARFQLVLPQDRGLNAQERKEYFLE